VNSDRPSVPFLLLAFLEKNKRSFGCGRAILARPWLTMTLVEERAAQVEAGYSRRNSRSLASLVMTNTAKVASIAP